MNAIKLGSLVGKVVMVDGPFKQGKMMRSFLRARVLIDVKAPMVTGFWVPLDNMDDVWAEVKYEYLLTFCYRCGVIRHEQRQCSQPDTGASEYGLFGNDELKGNQPRGSKDSDGSKAQIVQKMDSGRRTGPKEIGEVE
ncbi:hypothetical protein K1719_002553 [Acacia pycnantha]|nr:hypothetical protein K1719_002553 [Acacia pycnantha]